MAVDDGGEVAVDDCGAGPAADDRGVEADRTWVEADGCGVAVDGSGVEDMTRNPSLKRLFQ
ncbi:hypothetical protein [Streptomyces sp. SID3343]|uniref:hypothetical protein n=1 Tax=Streptomyces sp. SID3343 TaxID=2690260 RepID=UPI0019286CE4